MLQWELEIPMISDAYSGPTSIMLIQNPDVEARPANIEADNRNIAEFSFERNVETRANVREEGNRSISTVINLTLNLYDEAYHY